MTDYHSLDRRLIGIEHQLAATMTQLKELGAKLEENNEQTERHSKILDRILWTAVGACLLYSASRVGLFELVSKLIL